MSLFSDVKSVAEKSSDTIPEIKETLTELKALIMSIRKVIPVLIICLVIIAISAIGTMAGVVVLLLK